VSGSTGVASNVVVEGSGAAAQRADFERAVVEQLRQLVSFETGRSVLDAIARVPRRLTIRPWRGPGVNAEARPVSWADGAPRGVPVFDRLGQRLAGLRGTGLGSDVVVSYAPTAADVDAGGWTPTMRAAWQAMRGRAPAAAACGEQLLLHELVRAYRYMLGVAHPRPMRLNFDTHEEQIAVVVTSLYCAERGARPLRADRRPSSASMPDARGSVGSCEYRRTLLAAALDMPRLTDALARVPVVPNPFAPCGTPPVGDVQDLSFGGRS
jgi:hypothetical protein